MSNYCYKVDGFGFVLALTGYFSSNTWQAQSKSIYNLFKHSMFKFIPILKFKNYMINLILRVYNI